MSSGRDDLGRKIRQAFKDSDATDERRVKVAQLRHEGHRLGGSKRAHAKQAEKRRRFR